MSTSEALSHPPTANSPDSPMSGTEMSAVKKNDTWWISFALRWGLLFSVLSYVDSLPGRWDLVPFVLSANRLIAPYSHHVYAAARWLGAHAFGLKMQGQFWNVGLSTLVPILPSFLWTLFDRRIRVNEVLRDAIYIVVRYTLAAAMFNYGIAKLVIQQGGPQPAPLEWVRPLGTITTGQSMWTWLGYSPIFEFFAGLNEMVGAILLLFRRTTLLGALLILPVMAYVTALDTTFHVGPGAYAALYGVGALYLVAREWRRLAKVFFSGKPSSPLPSKRLWGSRRMVLAGRGLWVVVVLFTVRGFVFPHVMNQVDIGGRQSPLCGVYQVDSFVSDGRVLPEEAANPARWREVAIGWFGNYIRVRRMDDSELLWSLDPGGPYPFMPAMGHEYKFGDWGRLLAKTAGIQEQLRFRELPNYGSPHNAALLPVGPVPPQTPGFRHDYNRGQFFTLNIVRNGSDQVLLQGHIDGAEISADLRRINNNDFPLFRTRGKLP